MVYCEPIDVILTSGMYNTIINETIGTGDASIVEFSLDKTKIVDKSEKIYIDGELKTKSSDYTINNERGVVTFFVPPTTSATVTADYKYILPETTSEDIEDYIESADAEIENWAGKKFSSGNIATEYFKGRAELISASSDISQGQYYSETDEDKYMIMLSNYPVQSVTSLEFLDDDGDVDDTLVENTDFHVWDYGKIWLITKKIPEGVNKKKVKIIYTYGYSSVPVEVKQLSAVLATMRWLIAMTGGSYVDMASYSLGGISVSVGVPYMNLKSALVELNTQKAYLLNMIGREFRSVVI